MIDKTTIGVTAEPEEVQAVLHNLCGYHLAEPDPLERYNVLTREQVLYEALAAAIKLERGRALADLAGRGHSLAQVAGMTNLTTRQRVQRLIQMSKAAQETGAEASAEAQAASREFHERLAAVEATLDEVVSGLIHTEPTHPEPAHAEPLPAYAGPRLAELSEPAPPTFEQPDTAAYPLLPIARGPVDDLDAMNESTEPLPVLHGLLHPTKEMPPHEESTPWWRRSAAG
jgi:malonyl CoA-acyl carrier protein transacylase